MANKTSKTSKKTPTTTTHTRAEAFALGREAALTWIVESGGAGFYATVEIQSYGLPGEAAELMEQHGIDAGAYEARTAFERAFEGALSEVAQKLTEAVSEDTGMVDDEIGNVVDEVVQQVRADDAREDAELAAEEEAAE